jgi:hypothetical protein
MSEEGDKPLSKEGDKPSSGQSSSGGENTKPTKMSQVVFDHAPKRSVDLGRDQSKTSIQQREQRKPPSQPEKKK